MIRTDKFAYRASPELTAALRDLSERITRFHTEVVTPWEECNTEVTSVWHRRLGYENECIGFTVRTPGAPTPPGLSSNKERDWLIPKRGEFGDPWRADLERLNQRPRLAPVLRQFGVEPTITVIDHGRIYTPGLVPHREAFYLTWGHPHPDPGPHLTGVPLSEYYLALEETQAETQVEQPVSST